MEIPRGPADSG
jgi:hypothetical protein